MRQLAPRACVAAMAIECEVAAAPPVTSVNDLPVACSGGEHSAFARIPRRLLIEVLALLAPEDTVRISLCGQFFAPLGVEGLLWRHLFSRRYPSSELTAANMTEWKHCFLLEVNGIEADLTCFHTKASFRETVLGVPVDFSVNPRTNCIDYISSTMELLSVEAFDKGVRKTQWNEDFKAWLPLFLTPDHFQRAKLRFERSVVQLSPHWKASRFHPFMVLEVLPKLMNTMVVLLCDKGLGVSDRALDCYFQLWRLLLASVQTYGLQKEVSNRPLSFRTPENRTTANVPSLSDFLPLLGVSGVACGWVSLCLQLAPGFSAGPQT